MTDISSVFEAGPHEVGNDFGAVPYRVNETYWGYIIHKANHADTGTMLLQTASMLLGAGFTAAGIGLLLLPEVLSGSTDFTIRGTAAVVFFGFAAYLLWYASRGTQSEVQIDKALGEVREVVRNRAGKPTLIGRYGFDSIGGVFLDRANATGHNQAMLVLRYRNTAQTLPIVSGDVTVLQPLCQRVGRDLMMEIKPTRPERTIVPTTL